MKIGRVISSELATNRDGESKVLLLALEVAEADDIQTVELFRQAGDECRPDADATVLIADLGAAWRVAIAADDGIEPEAEPGERGIYASEGGEKKSQVMCRKDGMVEAGLTGLALVAIADKVIAALLDAADKASAAAIPNDGGKAAFAAFKSSIALADVASANLKAEAP